MKPRIRFALLFVGLWVIAFALVFVFQIHDGDYIFLISIAVLAITFVLNGFIERYLEKRT